MIYTPDTKPVGHPGYTFWKIVAHHDGQIYGWFADTEAEARAHAAQLQQEAPADEVVIAPPRKVH